MSLNPEHTPLPELSVEAIEGFQRTFINRLDCYPKQLNDGSYVTIKKKLTLQLLASHLKGSVTVGSYALDEQSMARWLCFDADQRNHWLALIQMAEDLFRKGITSYIEPSRRGGHLWLFTSPLLGLRIRKFGKSLLNVYGLEGLELYPKQDTLSTGPGSLVRLPFGIHRLTGKRYHFVSLKGEPLAPTVRQQIEILSHPDQVSLSFIDECIAAYDSAPLQQQKTEIFAKVSTAYGETLSERIKASISVSSFVSRYIDLDELGKGFCPFHDDQHKSFGVHRERNFWHCYAGCGGGSIIDFWMKWRSKSGLDASFSATVKDLAQLLF